MVNKVTYRVFAHVLDINEIECKIVLSYCHFKLYKCTYTIFRTHAIVINYRLHYARFSLRYIFFNLTGKNYKTIIDINFHLIIYKRRMIFVTFDLFYNYIGNRNWYYDYETSQG